jgi:deaminated glutathione amidase
MTTPSASSYRIACVQLSSQDNLALNIANAGHWIAQAHKQKAQCVMLPENVAFMGKDKNDLLAHSFTEKTHPALQAFCNQAATLKLWILVGSLPIKTPGQRKIANRSFLIRPDGTIHAHYTKIHLYDVTVKDGESHHESATCQAGKTATLTKTPFGMLGMTICYDLRFPHLYRRLAQKGAQILAVPSAFTHYTGQAHWHILLRARAIETGSYIIAPAQTGTHPSGRKTFGHSLIVNPWGEVLADGGEKEGIIVADIDTGYVTDIRKQLPSLQLEQKFSILNCP